MLNPTGEVVVYQSDQDVFSEYELFARRLRADSTLDQDQFCFPINTANDRLAVICL